MKVKQRHFQIHERQEDSSPGDSSKRNAKEVLQICVHAQSCLTLPDSTDCSLQAPLSMGFPRQEYWSGLPFPPLADLPNPVTEPMSLLSLALAAELFATVQPGEPKFF